jgi:hypothetical protein
LVLFELVIGDSGKTDPDFRLKRGISFFHIGNSLEFIFALFTHKNHFAFPDGFLIRFRDKFKADVTDIFSNLIFFIFKAGFKKKLGK